MTDYLCVECTFDLLNKARIEIGYGENGSKCFLLDQSMFRST
jgi:hypothetical protein